MTQTDHAHAPRRRPGAGLLVLGTLGLLLVVAAAGTLLGDRAPASAGVTAPDRDRIARELQRENRAALGVHWLGDRTLLVGMLDDGTRRDGLARSYCEMLRERGVARGVEVRIQDNAASAAGTPRVIGSARCGPR